MEGGNFTSAASLTVVRFSAIIKKFDQQGEKTGWSYIEISAVVAQRLNPNQKKSYRVKGKLDQQAITGVALLPMGNGQFILPLNASMRKLIRKQKGAKVDVQLEVDNAPVTLSKALLDCLQDEPQGLKFFRSLPGSHQIYFSHWIEAAKTEPTKTKRIVMAVTALSKGLGFGQMLRLAKSKDLGGEV